MPYVKPQPVNTISDKSSIREDEKPKTSGIIEIVIMKKTVLHVYPNGQAYIQKHLGMEWVAGMAPVMKQKASDKQGKKKDLEEIKIVEGESY